ncbi:hypothetical protein BO85DRAFT_360409 [Aspergillus piperis CBS 112811]|uniref:T6SS Phospholipase effector Tle1-like catalytic domain-containing protein n=1 Tax=Aspergillus piperis CBS 112811 TaxID=1448313 RepID=A0A8G1RBB5_9EURO|nr:hypothetical protein BO85DRAFT_360409 [Aspergillus piperis CBS 112811]RAH63521.1 hypothetical protein BO85DRAFT_360409 [Aspergillus piperis CBS 112811]
MERTAAGNREFVLCFDGTGYKFRGDESDSNVLKIYRMLNRHDPRQFHYYQPGFGTHTTSIWQASKASTNRLKRWFTNMKDSAAGTTFEEHVIDGYRFLMRFYSPGDAIYIFGFSRGAYVARMLAEMIDHVGLLEPGNEGKVRYVWMTFSKWAKCTNSVDTGQTEKDDLYKYMKALRETFCRPVSQIRFLGLFDTVNSIPRFEVNRNKFLFPFTAKTSARVIRHAVSIDEHRAKFRQDLISDCNPNRPSTRRKKQDQPEQQGRCTGEAFYRPAPANTLSEAKDGLRDESQNTCQTQDIEEVWFAGCHSDIGGGLKLDDDEAIALSHVPLVWMVQEAQRAGLQFDREKMKLFHCLDDPAAYRNLPGQPEPSTGIQTNGDYAVEKGNEFDFKSALRRATTIGHVHDFLQYGQGVSWPTALTWKIVEYLPFRRLALQPDGSWKPVRWPLPLGEKRDLPKGAKVHGSVIRRMKANQDYRPENLLRDGKGKNKRPLDSGIGAWEVHAYEGCPVREIYRRKSSETG